MRTTFELQEQAVKLGEELQVFYQTMFAGMGLPSVLAIFWCDSYNMSSSVECKAYSCNSFSGRSSMRTKNPFNEVEYIHMPNDEADTLGSFI